MTARALVSGLVAGFAPRGLPVPSSRSISTCTWTTSALLTAEVLSLGAELLQAAGDLDAKSGFQVYADPAGHPFCLCWD